MPSLIPRPSGTQGVPHLVVYQTDPLPEAEDQGGQAAARFLTLPLFPFPEHGLDHFGAAHESLAGSGLETLAGREVIAAGYELLMGIRGMMGVMGIRESGESGE